MTELLTMRSEVAVEGVNGLQITGFLLGCDDERYQRWWPGVHLRFHATVHGPGHVGDQVLMDEYIGERRVRMSGVVVEAIPGEKIVWQLRKGLRLPVRLTLDLVDREDGVLVRHTVTAGYRGIGRVLDPLLRCYFTPAFVASLDRHVQTEFPLLRDHLRGRRARGRHPLRGL